MSIYSYFGRHKYLNVSANHRLIAFHMGKIFKICMPGRHRLPNRHGSLVAIFLDIWDPRFVEPYAENVLALDRQNGTHHLTEFRSADDEIVLIERDGRYFDILAPGMKMFVWTDAGPWSSSAVNISTLQTITPSLLYRIPPATRSTLTASGLVPSGQAGLLLIDGVYQATLPPGLHAYWSVGHDVKIVVMDEKWQFLDVNGQELLTRDPLTIRFNLTARYRIVDAALAFNIVKDPVDALYRQLQSTFRSALGSLTLSQILERKVSIGDEANASLSVDMLEFGIEVSGVDLKDVILPGEMRDILNQVVAAEKQAEANVIRRREETNATRSLLNTARVMAENPVMLRLKELEALENISGRIGHITIHNGTTGLLNDLVRLRDKEL